jgi:hypothetical protein
VEDGTTAQLFVGEASFAAGTGTVSTPALSPRRYTPYTVAPR